MAFWDIFTSKSLQTKTKSNLSQLHHRLQEMLPENEEKELVMVACLAGLLARVAYIDFEIHKDEASSMQKTIEKWTNLKANIATAVVEVAIEEIKELSGLENHLYCHPLNEILGTEEKYAILEALFDISASDGTVSPHESEEIRIISKGLRLEHRHFISAKATVLNSSKI